MATDASQKLLSTADNTPIRQQYFPRSCQEMHQTPPLIAHAGPEDLGTTSRVVAA
jgi:hypothetical protein